MTPSAFLVPLIGPAINKLADIVRALKEPLGKQGVDQLRGELQQALENVNIVLEQQTSFAQAMANEIAYLRARVEYLELPFWKRWFTAKPVAAGRDTTLSKRS